MSSKILSQINRFIHQIERIIPSIFGNGYPPAPMHALACPSYEMDAHDYQTSEQFSLKDLIVDGMLWAVPKSRRSLERRQKRKFAYKESDKNWVLPRINLVTCQQCGGDHEIGHLCVTCYRKVIEETRAMQTAIVEKLGLDPVDKEVVVLYDGEKDKPNEFWEGKRVIEIEKQRPSWFNKNLLQKTTQPKATTKNVKPTDLG